VAAGRDRASVSECIVLVVVVRMSAAFEKKRKVGSPLKAPPALRPKAAKALLEQQVASTQSPGVLVGPLPVRKCHQI
jgi:hypothetical protein